MRFNDVDWIVIYSGASKHQVSPALRGRCARSTAHDVLRTEMMLREHEVDLMKLFRVCGKYFRTTYGVSSLLCCKGFVIAMLCSVYHLRVPLATAYIGLSGLSLSILSPQL